MEDAPTLPIGAPTRAGVIMGTAAYMSPEQARGKAADKRADIWAFGVVLYEMVVGRPLFPGETVTDILAAVLQQEPDLGNVPPKFQPLLRKCLQKDPKNRLRDIGDMELLLHASPAAPSPRRFSLWIACAALLLLALIVVSALHFTETPARARVIRFQISVPKGTTSFGLNLSPDGRLLAFNAPGVDDKVRVWVRPLDSVESQPLAGTEGVNSVPFWSPDSRFIAFRSEGKLKKVDVSGGQPQTLCDFQGQGGGGGWSPKGIIIFSSPQAVGIQRVLDSGGVPAALSVSANARVDGRFPFLPDGRGRGRRADRPSNRYRMQRQLCSLA